jgi:8-oxo-dGTP pyrophosphatase MutT (NUDIX family)
MASNVAPVINHSTNYCNEIFCMNCGKKGHIFKNCTDAVHSYGLLCFYKKKALVKDNTLNNDYFNRKTKKNGGNSHKRYNYRTTPASLSNIKILKRSETINHTLKNMLGIVGDNPNDTMIQQQPAQDDIDGPIDIDQPEVIIDMDGIYDEGANYNGNCKETVQDDKVDDRVVAEEKTEDDTEHDKDVKMKEITMQKVLLVQRRNTIGLIEFARGKYDVTDHEHIIKLFNMMTFDEKRMLREYDSFDMIRTVMGMKRDYNHRIEYDESKKKFNELKNNPNGDLVFALLDKSYTKWTGPEWGVPKGRRNNKEYDIECAIREFVEETGIKYKNINVYRNIKPLVEIYRGINGVLYKHVYYIAEMKDNEEARQNVEQVEKGGFINNEISNVKFFNLTDVQKIIRPYYMSKLNAIKKGFQIINCLGTYFE